MVLVVQHAQLMLFVAMDQLLVVMLVIMEVPVHLNAKALYLVLGQV